MTEIAEVRLSCGRCYLSVAGIAVAMEGDRCRDGTLPESIMPEIPEHELANASIGGKPAAELPTEMVRFFRGDNWTSKMLRYVAARINQQHRNSHAALLEACIAAEDFADGFVDGAPDASRTSKAANSLVNQLRAAIAAAEA
jgi:hypothetical protein